MTFLKKMMTHALVIIAISALIMGCARRPNAEELAQLEDLKAEVASLEREIGSKQQERSQLQQQVSQLDQNLRTCAEDKEKVRQRLQQWN
jgi:chromosome segregation ATPase